jgi:hypothetical protein
VSTGAVTAALLSRFLSLPAARPLIEVPGVAVTFTWAGIAGEACLIAVTPHLIRRSHRVKEKIR